MSDYKAAKEAFVSDNPGSSIYTILAVSLVAWTSYALYATLYPRIKPSFTSDYLTSALPLLLGVTIFATTPITYNISLLTLSTIIYLLSPRSRRRQPGGSKKDQSKGSWLEESDSDEEIAEPTSTTTSTQNTPIKLPSQVALTSAHEYSASPSPSIVSGSSNPTSPSNLSVDDPFSHVGVNKRRLSPQPSPDNITVNILPTPPTAESDSLPTSSNYPTNSKARTRNVSTPSTIRVGKHEEDGQKKRTLPFLSVYRAHMMIMTVHCILAVDFKVFPRWLGKCEDFGTSLMDVGVGSFVFSLGLISLKSLNPDPSFTATTNPPSSPGLTLARKDTAQTLPTELYNALRKSLPTLILGFIRLMMVKGVEYPEHVTEYGVHWNFFFTIGLLPVFGVLVRPLRKTVSWRLLGIGISLVQQVILTGYGVQSYLLSPSREGIIGQNKEGLSSLPGYIAIYLLGLSIGENISKLEVATPPPTEVADEHAMRQYEKRRMELILQLFGHSVVYWGSLGWWLWFNGDGDGRVSRRFANTPYVLFIASYNTLFLLGYLLLESTFPDIPTPALLESINRNGLVVFLGANLGTGLVNVCMDSMYAGRVVSMGVLGMYSLGVCGVAWAIRGRRIKI